MTVELSFWETASIEQKNKLEQFQKKFSRENLLKINLDDYVIGKKKDGYTNKETFCYKVEYDLDFMGSNHIMNTSPMYGVFFGKKQNDYVYPKEYSSAKEAFTSIIKKIVELIHYGQEYNLEAIRNLNLHQVLKSKLLSIYFPDKFLTIHTQPSILFFMNKLGIKDDNPHKLTLDLQLKLINWKRNNSDYHFNKMSLFQFTYYLYKTYGEPTNKVNVGRNIKNPDEEKNPYDSFFNKNILKSLFENKEVKKTKISPREAVIRSNQLRQYAKLVAHGYCQLCGNKAPFETESGPFLETHHIDWLSEGGNDSVENVVAICPNCHRKMHYINDYDDVLTLKNKAIENKEEVLEKYKINNNETTKMQATGTVMGKKVVLLWSKGKGISLKHEDDLLNEIIQVKIEDMERLKHKELFVIANNFIVEKKSAVWAYIIFQNIFDKLEKIEMNGKTPTIPYEEGVIY